MEALVEAVVDLRGKAVKAGKEGGKGCLGCEGQLDHRDW